MYDSSAISRISGLTRARPCSTGIGIPRTATGACPPAASTSVSACRWVRGASVGACHTWPQDAGLSATATKVRAMSRTSVQLWGRSGRPITQAALPSVAVARCRVM